MGDEPLQNYYNNMILHPGTIAAAKVVEFMPFPGGKGRIWECPSAHMALATIGNGTLQPPSNPPQHYPGPGGTGFFSYVMNCDLKRNSNINGDPDFYQWPNMSKLTYFRQPSATVLMFDGVFDPISEVVNGASGYNSVNPALRQRSFASRHTGGGVINFLDGHAAWFKCSYITNNPSDLPYNEPILPDVIWDAPARGAEFGM
jgi:prepilin-type processing-associated H-X9-DG protein